MDNFLRLLSLSIFVTLCYSLAVKRDLRCGSDTFLTQNNGEIISHAGFEFGHHYGKYLNCSWTIKAPQGQFVEMVAKNFSVYQGFGSSCYGDYVELYDGDSVSSRSMGRYCGNTFNPVTSTGNSLTLKFVTDGYTQYQGFKLFYNFTNQIIRSCPGNKFRCDNGYCLASTYKCDQDDDCGDDSDEMNCPVVTCPTYDFSCPHSHKCIPLRWICDGYNDCTDHSDELSSNCHLHTTTTTVSPSLSCGQRNFTSITGTIHSPNYPSNYPSMAYCMYQIFAPSWTHSLSFSFNSNFNLESNSVCSYDYVKIYSDGFTYTHGPYCGPHAPLSFAIPRNHAIIVFSSDGSTQYQGFQLTWSAT